MKPQIQPRLFIGFIVNGEMKMHLNQSATWKEAALFQSADLNHVHFENKEYIGQFLELALNYEELKQKEKELKNRLQHYCPNLNLESLTAYLFPQTFIS